MLNEPYDSHDVIFLLHIWFKRVSVCLFLVTDKVWKIGFQIVGNKEHCKALMVLYISQ